jgi:hypothetical protein
VANNTRSKREGALRAEFANLAPPNRDDGIVAQPSRVSRRDIRGGREEKEEEDYLKEIEKVKALSLQVSQPTSSGAGPSNQQSSPGKLLPESGDQSASPESISKESPQEEESFEVSSPSTSLGPAQDSGDVNEQSPVKEQSILSEIDKTILKSSGSTPSVNDSTGQTPPPPT